MPYTEMVVDSIRLAKYRDEWVILLREKEGHRYLPVYVNKEAAYVMGKVLEGEAPEQIMDEDVQHILSAAEKITLVIDSLDNGVYNAECITGWEGKPARVKCSIGKILAICHRTDGYILAEEQVLEKAGIAAKV
mgnify:CR=1 FL=1